MNKFAGKGRQEAWEKPQPGRYPHDRRIALVERIEDAPRIGGNRYRTTRHV